MAETLIKEQKFVVSENIRVFPCGGRNATIDAGARLTTEYNLVSIINRLVDQGSFVITPSYSYVANNTNEFTFNIGGYLFTLTASGVDELVTLVKNKSLLDANGKAANNKKYCLVAYIKPTNYGNPASPFQELSMMPDSSGSSTGEGGSVNTELTYSAGILDVSALGSSYFKGVSFLWCELDATNDITVNDLVEVRYDYHLTTANTYVWNNRQSMENTVPFVAAYKKHEGEDSVDGTTQAPFYVPNTETQLVLLYADENTALSIPADSKIRFETSRDGFNRSCRIDDGVL